MYLSIPTIDTYFKKLEIGDFETEFKFKSIFAYLNIFIFKKVGLSG